MNDLISIIIPIYKVEAYLRDCLNSVQKQTYTNFEVLLIMMVLLIIQIKFV